MVKRCKTCKRYVAGTSGLCYKCFDKQSEEAKKNFEI
jgi:RNA polymerase subunit RPABC4/transcription elongation factor Spt4